EMCDRGPAVGVDPLGRRAQRADLVAMRCRIGVTLAPLLRERRVELTSRRRLRLLEGGAMLRAGLGELAPHDRETMLRLLGLGGSAGRSMGALLLDTADLRLERRNALAQRLDDRGGLRAGIVDDREDTVPILLQ